MRNSIPHSEITSAPFYKVGRRLLKRSLLESDFAQESPVNDVVKLERADVIAVVTVNSPPVNALSAAVRRGIYDAIKTAGSDPQVQAIVLTCAGRTFIAGADITEFGKPPQSPGLG